jgi:MFS family permease
VTAGCGLIMGYLVDNFNRKLLLIVCSLCWNILTGTTAYCNTFLQILFPRMLVAAFSSACIPTAISLINDYFNHDQKARANSFFFFGIYIGAALSSLTALLD